MEGLAASKASIHQLSVAPSAVLTTKTPRDIFERALGWGEGDKNHLELRSTLGLEKYFRSLSPHLTDWGEGEILILICLPPYYTRQAPLWPVFMQFKPAGWRDVLV